MGQGKVDPTPTSGQTSPGSGSVTPSKARTVAAMLLAHRAGRVKSVAPAEPPSDEETPAVSASSPAGGSDVGNIHTQSTASTADTSATTSQAQAPTHGLTLPDGPRLEESELMEAPTPRPEERVSRSAAVSEELTLSELPTLSISASDKEDALPQHSTRSEVDITRSAEADS